MGQTQHLKVPAIERPVLSSDMVVHSLHRGGGRARFVLRVASTLFLTTGNRQLTTSWRAFARFAIYSLFAV